MDGVLLIDKPPGMTSHDVVALVRRALGGVRTGHAGTLDPFATGLLLVLVGRATKSQRALME
ncbi:MAG: tRNA pseudouridine(55) synthase TruB, partial [Actinomycetota bacterium]|nr:tRNA pseudouridine(55) synthase TruB [Actinomycetota bacterium]